MDTIRVAVDIAIFTIRENALHVLLVKRGIDPYKGRWAIPGGFVHENESLEAAARRELVEETGVKDVFLEQLYTFGDPGRDPRGRVVTVAYYALVSADRALRAGTDAAEAAWFLAHEPPPLAFDHAKILATAIARLQGKLDYTTIGFELLPRKFTLTDLQRVYEAVLDRPLDKRNFRRRVAGLVRPLRELRRGGRRPARLYEFVPPRKD